MAVGELAQIRANTVLQKGTRFTLLRKVQPVFFTVCWRSGTIAKSLHRKKMDLCEQKGEAKTRRAEWCTATSRYHCRKNSDKMKMPDCE